MRILFLLLLSCASLSAQADWQLEPSQSRVNFVTTKNLNIREVHHFNHIEATIDAQGAMTLDIHLASVKTGIGIRDQRMQSMLFAVEAFPKATLTAQVGELLKAKVGAVQQPKGMSANLSIRGNNKPVSVAPSVVKLDKDTLLVTVSTPVIINAQDYDLSAGVEALRQIAGLSTIGNSVPVTATLVFKNK